MSKRVLIVVLAVALLLAVSASGAGAASADDEVTIEYFIDPGNMARSANGDTIEVVGSGKFRLNDDGDISGRGEWSHRNAADSLLAKGTWRARSLLSYETYGPQAVVDGFVLPEGSEGGLALIGVRMRVDGGPAFDAYLTVDCLLGDEIQDGAHEGTTVDPTTGPGKQRNFSEKLEGLTLFVRHGGND